MEDRKEIMESRRDAVKKMAYVAPFVLSLAASPAFASSGSGSPPRRGRRPPHKSRPHRSFVNN